MPADTGRLTRWTQARDRHCSKASANPRNTWRNTHCPAAPCQGAGHTDCPTTASLTTVSSACWRSPCLYLVFTCPGTLVVTVWLDERRTPRKAEGIYKCRRKCKQSPQVFPATRPLPFPSISQRSSTRHQKPSGMACFLQSFLHQL